jgi:hypothetical protein
MTNSISDDTRYDIITDFPTFIKLRSKRIHDTYADEVFIIKRAILVVNYIMDNLIPNLYFTRSECEVAEYHMTPHSVHDSARNLCSLFVYDYNQILISLCTGCYDSAIICSRSIFEWSIRTISAVSDLSILTNKESDKHKAVCFEVLLKLMDVSNHNKKLSRNDKKTINHELKSLKEKEDAEFFNFIDTLVKIKLSFGLGDLPKKLSSSILKYFKIETHNKKINGAKALYYVYEILSKYTHKDVSQIIKSHPEGLTEFFNRKEFEEIYNIIILILDIQLCLLLLVIDIDVYSSNKKARKKWRSEVKKIFEDANLWSKSTFKCTMHLINSQVWNSKDVEKIIKFD